MSDDTVTPMFGRAPKAPVQPVAKPMLSRPLSVPLPSWAFDVDGELVNIIANTFEGALHGLAKVRPTSRCVQFAGIGL